MAMKKTMDISKTLTSFIKHQKRNVMGVIILISVGILTACQQASLSDTMPIVKKDTIGTAKAPLYLRGSFNGWGISHKFTDIGNDLYTTVVEVTPGNYGFKVAPENWSIEWVINPSSSEIVEYNKRYELTAAKAPEDFLFSLKTGHYQFNLDMSVSAQPMLTIIKKSNSKKVSVNPHINNNNYKEIAYENFDKSEETVGYSVDDLSAQYRQYTHSTTLSLRDPGPQHKQYSELVDQPTVRSGSVEFDALFALALNEMKSVSVSHIRDGNYDNGKDIECNCFKTGQKWEYVWTRDLSYAADLSFALLDPKRVENSLNFKTSTYREGTTKPLFAAGSENGLQIIQDTGSGGSWPVSTDRVTWAFSAEELLKSLYGEEKEIFATRALTVLINTIENDRIAAFDSTDGLYTGEQSFLDWREQTYASWIVDDLSTMATSKALSTNVAHYKAISLTAMLAEQQNKPNAAKKYKQWAQQLNVSINKGFWLEDVGLYSSLTAGHFNNAPLHKYDWLGQSLAIITGVADKERAQQVLANYPHGPMGAPVIFPQQQVAVYHNRAIWPFVTAYGLKAANKLSQVAVADAAYETLIRGAAVNMSNMENLEWLTGQPMFLDKDNPELSGPVINSNYQLWSVAAYLNMVIENIYGVTLTNTGLSITPFITSKLHKRFFKNNVIELKHLTVQGKVVSVKIRLPELSDNDKDYRDDEYTDEDYTDGYYTLGQLTLNGKVITSSTAVPTIIHRDQLTDNNVIEVELTKLKEGKQALTRVFSEPLIQTIEVSSPLEPVIEATIQPMIKNAEYDNNSVSFTIKSNPLTNNDYVTYYNVFREGKLIAEHVKEGVFIDNKALNRDHCYAVEAVYESGNRSHHSKPYCLGEDIIIYAQDKRINSNIAVSEANNTLAVKHLAKWGKPTDQLSINDIIINNKRKVAIQISYHNDSHVIGQGITAGVKVLTIYDENNQIIKQGVIQLPHVRVKNNRKIPVYSTPIITELVKGTYHIKLTDFYNMSYLKSNNTFSATGGLNGAVNQFDFVNLRLKSID